MTNLQSTLIAAARHQRKLNVDFPLHMNVHEDGILVRAMNGEDRFSTLVSWENISDLDAAIDDAVRAVS